jgi:hypothetical protein
MANINKDYSITEANKIFKKYNELSRFDPLIKTRETKAVYFRALLYKVMMEFNYMNDRQIANYFLSKGRKIDRVSVFQAVRKIDIYYRDFADFRNLYDVYFEDKSEDNRLIQERKTNRLNKLNSKVDKSAAKYNNDALNKLINNLPLHRRDEVLERLQLMVKSWAWKSRDKCEIIEASEGITESVY